MPSRYIREGINDSEKVNMLDDSEEVFYRRLLSEVDDYGRFSAHPSLLRAACYPLKLDRIKEDQVLQWLDKLSKVGLIVVYKHDSKTFLEVLNFGQRIRGKSKYPSPPETVVQPVAEIVEKVQEIVPEPVKEDESADNCQSNDGQLTVTCPHSTFYRYSVFDIRYSSTDKECAQFADNKSIQFFCKRKNQKTPCLKIGDNVLLTPEEAHRMISDWGESFAREAIKQYDTKYPNSPSIQKHSDHNKGIRDYVTRGFICAGKQISPQKEKPVTKKLPPEEIADPGEIGKIMATLTKFGNINQKGKT